MPTSRPLIRPGRDSDAGAFIALIWACWSRYPGVRMDVDGEMPELHALATYYTGQGGALWAAESDGRVIGMIATRPLQDGVWEICRVYADPALHGSGLGHHLLTVAESHAMAAGATRLVLWSDTRFDRAHRFYEKRSYVRQGPIRVLQDISHSLEYAYAKPVDGIEVLDAAAAASAVPALVRVMTDCMNEGSYTPFRPPLAPEAARAFWQEIARNVATGVTVLLGAWSGGTLAGVVTLVPSADQTQPHRAEISMLLTSTASNADILAARLLDRVAAEALKRGRKLLTFMTLEGDRLEAACRAKGWSEAGRIPALIRRIDGTCGAGVLLWQRLP